MFGEVTYDEKNNTYQAIYKAKDERTATWIPDQYENVGLDGEIDSYVFAYKRDVVLSTKSEEVATNQLRDRLNHELAAVMAGIQEITIVVRRIFDLYLKGYSVDMIIKELADTNTRSPLGKDKWSKRAIQTMLANEKYNRKRYVGKNIYWAISK